MDRITQAALCVDKEMDGECYLISIKGKEGQIQGLDGKIQAELGQNPE